MSLIISLIVYLIVLGLLYWLVTLLPLPEPAGRVIQVLFILLVILIVLSVFGIIPGAHFPLVHISG